MNTKRKAAVFALGFIAGFSALLSIMPQTKKATHSGIAADNSRLKNDMAKIGKDMYKAMQKASS